MEQGIDILLGFYTSSRWTFDTCQADSMGCQTYSLTYEQY